MKYELKTKNGYDFFECSSAMQKSIRRGIEDEAIFWAVELFESNYAEYIWKRLRIISSEDVGLGEPHISSEIWALYEISQSTGSKIDPPSYGFLLIRLIVRPVLRSNSVLLAYLPFLLLVLVWLLDVAFLFS